MRDSEPTFSLHLAEKLKLVIGDVTQSHVPTFSPLNLVGKIKFVLLSRSVYFSAKFDGETVRGGEGGSKRRRKGESTQEKEEEEGRR